MRRILAMTCLLLGTGCALRPQLGPPPMVGPPYLPPPEPVWVVIDPALFASSDSTAETATEARPRAPVAGERTSSGPAVRPPSPEAREPLPPPIDPGGAVVKAEHEPADSIRAVAARAALVSIDLDPEDQSRLALAARRNLSAADSLARLAGARGPSPRNPDKLSAARGLIRQAQEAMLRGDIRAAANLAYKARLLAAEAYR
jgi:hypothetical protein